MFDIDPQAVVYPEPREPDPHPAERALLEEWRREDEDQAIENRYRWQQRQAAESLLDEQLAAHAREEARDLLDQAEASHRHARELVKANMRAVARATDAKTKASAEARSLHSVKRAGEWAKVVESLRSSVTRVSEPAPYTRGGPYSWFADLAAGATRSHPDHEAALERLRRYGKDVAFAAADPTKEGRRIRRTLRDATRRPDDLRDRAEREFRAMTTGSGSGGALVTPAYIVEDWAKYRTYSPTFTEQACTMRPLPDYGMTVYVPRVTGTSGVTAQASENTAPDEVDPTATYAQVSVQTFTGMVTASEQLADRAGPIGFDDVIYTQLREQADTAMDAAVITAALAGVTALTRATYSTAGLLSDIAQMASSLETTAGTVLPPSALVTQPKTAEWLLAQVDGSQRPVFEPFPGQGSRRDGFTGFAVSQIPLYVDGSIPVSGSNNQLVITSNAAVYVYAGEPIVDAVPQTDAGQLSVIFRLRRYVATEVRYPAGVAAASGAAYPSAPTWA